MITIIHHPDFTSTHKVSVAVVQQRLLAAGHSPGLIDGIPGKDTRAAWDAWFIERTQHLSSAGPSHLALKIALLDACLGVKKGTPRKRELVLKGGGSENSGAWCAYGAIAWFRFGAELVNNRLISPVSGGVVRWWHKLDTVRKVTVDSARANPKLITAGMAFFRTRKAATVASVLRGGSSLGHMGLVERVDTDGWIWTVEANTNDTDSAVGGRVVAKKTLHLLDARLIGFAEMEFGL